MGTGPERGGWRRKLLVLAEEPPFRVFARALVKALPFSIRARARWDAAARPHYLLGVLLAADEARRENVEEICALEFGVAAGHGLLVLERYAAAVERETGVRIRVYGFDLGTGLPAPLADHRDHPDQWRPADFPMDEAALRARLAPRTELVLGDIGDTVPRFMRSQPAPVGFVSVDVDLYSSARKALAIVGGEGRRTLRRTILYFDDIQTDLGFTHRFAGELLAIDEFNVEHEDVKIDTWRGLVGHRPFPEEPYLRQLYVAHDLAAISRVRLERPAKREVSADP